MRNYTVVIPARGGSKRLPRKNVLELGGIPLISHSIRYAKEFFSNSSIFVNTDDKEIAEIAENEGVRITSRPSDLGLDTTSTLEVLQFQLDWFEENSIVCDSIVLLQATNPLRPKSLLEQGIKDFEESGRGSLASFSALNKKFGKIVNEQFIPENYTPGQRMQDIDPSYYENGLLYITKAQVIRDGAIISPDVYPLLVDHPFASVDIDELEDFNYAAFLLSRYKNL